MKKNRSEKNKTNTSIKKNTYCIELKNAEERTQGRGGQSVEGYSGSVWTRYNQ